MDKKIILSIIVPIFNTPIKYLKKCFDSLNNLDLNNIEIIIVDDCSSNIKIKKYYQHISQLNNWTYYVHAKNKGLAASRNTGIKNSSGKYIAFLDSDDQITSDYLETLLPIITTNQYDIVSFNFQTSINNKLTCWKTFVINHKDLLIHAWSSWSKVYKKSFLIETKTMFDNFNIACEDVFFVFNLFLNDNLKIKSINNTLYIYNKDNINSITKTNGKQGFISALDCYANHMLKILEKKEINGNIQLFINRFLLEPFFLNGKKVWISKKKIPNFILLSKYISSQNKKIFKKIYFKYLFSFPIYQLVFLYVKFKCFFENILL